MPDLTEIKKILQEPINKDRISAAISHESRLKFHGKIALSGLEMSRYSSEFLHWVEGLLPPDKYRYFLSLFRYPVQTVPLTSEIFEALAKIFDSRDPVYSVEFMKGETKTDYLKYRTDQLKIEEVLETRGFEAMKYGINAVLIVDLPGKQNSKAPEPYFYFLPIDSVLSYQMKDAESIDWIAFKQKDGRVAFFDSEKYWVFNMKGGSAAEIESVETEATHELGYCPARFFWSDPLSWETPELKVSPISEQLADLDWLLFFAYSKRHLDLYAPYPIYSGFSQDCDFENTEKGFHCSGGFLKTRENLYVYADNGRRVMECPVCAKNRLTGVGSFVEVDPPGPENDNADLRNPVSILPADRPSLDYNVEEVNRLATNIFTAVTGASIEVMRNQAINKDQVHSIFEARKATLNRLKRNFEKAQTWLEATICRLRYGKSFVSVSVNYGTEYYLLSDDLLLSMYEEKRAAKSSHAVLDGLQDQYIETKHRNNPKAKERARVLIALEPLRHVTPEEALGLFEKGLIGEKEYLLKVNFSSLLNRFERENLPILEFAENMNFAAKISKIREALLSYIEIQPKGEPAGNV
jgi:hypothetical protein